MASPYIPPDQDLIAEVSQEEAERLAHEGGELDEAANIRRRMQELHFDARVALPEAQELATVWETRAGELEKALCNWVDDEDHIHERYEEHVKTEREAYPNGIPEDEGEAWNARCPCTWCLHRREAREVLGDTNGF